MKESYIKNKVTKIAGWMKRSDSTAERMERDRKIAAIANQLSQELDRSFEEHKRHITRFAHHLLKDHLK